MLLRSADFVVRHFKMTIAHFVLVLQIDWWEKNYMQLSSPYTVSKFQWIISEKISNRFRILVDTSNYLIMKVLLYNRTGWNASICFHVKEKFVPYNICLIFNTFLTYFLTICNVGAVLTPFKTSVNNSLIFDQLVAVESLNLNYSMKLYLI